MYLHDVVNKGHYNDVIMGTMAPQITSCTISADKKNTPKLRVASLGFVRGIHRWPVISPYKGPVTRKMFPFNDVIVKKRRKFSRGILNTSHLDKMAAISQTTFSNDDDLVHRRIYAALDGDDTGKCLNIKISFYQYRDPRVKHRTVSRASHLYNGNIHTWKDRL